MTTSGGGGPSKSPWHRGAGGGVHPSQTEAQSKACRDKGERKDGGGRVRDKEIGGDDLDTELHAKPRNRAFCWDKISHMRQPIHGKYIREEQTPTCIETQKYSGTQTHTHRSRFLL